MHEFRVGEQIVWLIVYNAPSAKNTSLLRRMALNIIYERIIPDSHRNSKLNSKMNSSQ